MASRWRMVSTPLCAPCRTPHTALLHSGCTPQTRTRGVLHADVEVLNVLVEVALQTGDVQRVQVVWNYSSGSAMLTDGAGCAMNAVGFDVGRMRGFALPLSLLQADMPTGYGCPGA